MRTFLLIIIFAVSSTYSFSTASDMAEKETQISFERFLEALKNNEYRASQGLPVFRPENIDTLLKTAEREKVIYNFPRNPLSSFFAYSTPLKAICLWLVEGIRQHDTLLGVENRFPSNNPIINKAGERQYENTTQNLDKALELYKKWRSQKLDYQALRKKNPLEGSGLRWQ